MEQIERYFSLMNDDSATVIDNVPGYIEKLTNTIGSRLSELVNNIEESLNAMLSDYVNNPHYEVTVKRPEIRIVDYIRKCSYVAGYDIVKKQPVRIVKFKCSTKPITYNDSLIPPDVYVDCTVTLKNNIFDKLCMDVSIVGYVTNGNNVTLLDCCNIEQLFIAPYFRRKGIGEKFLKSLSSQFLVSYVSIPVASAIGFYAKCNYIPVFNDLFTQMYKSADTILKFRVEKAPTYLSSVFGVPESLITEVGYMMLPGMLTENNLAMIHDADNIKEYIKCIVSGYNIDDVSYCVSLNSERFSSEKNQIEQAFKRYQSIVENRIRLKTQQ